jgi:membrane protease YdiL (CAAX protease family)
MRTTPLLIYILGIFAMAAITAYPAFALFELLGVEEVTFDELVMRLLKVYALLGLWPLLATLGINTRASWGYGPGPGGRGFLKGLLLGTGIGIAMLGIVVLALLALEVRVAKPGLEITSASVGVLVLKAVISGLLVGLIEETWFRGGLHTGIARMTNTLFAMVFISCVYGAVHFISADVNIPPDEVRWSSGIVVLANSFHRFRDTPFADSLFALVAAGMLLALVRHRTGRIAECIGIHAGWVMVIQTFRKLTYPNAENTWTFMVGSFDGVIGLMVGVWFSALCVGYFFRYVRRVPIG